MKIIAGKWGGQSVPGKPSPKLRPTADKVKEAIFSQLEARWVSGWEGVRVLDLFAGTGSLGFEALSRGAESVVFVDHHLQTIKSLQKAAEGFEATAQTELLCKGALEAVRWLSKRGDRFDLIFLDPPYREDWVAATLNVLQDQILLRKKGLVIVEHDKRELLTPTEGLWKNEGSRRYGDSMVSFLTPMPK